jgi:CRISPR/Cas system-associated protein Cas10 (large subunit of type III CRISPR-Cas system)
MNEIRKGNLLFVGGDLSGIQNFIYNISSEKAAVSLKGRSAYISNYTDEVYTQLTTLPEVEAAGVEMVYCSSGKFYFITLDTPEIRKKLTQCSHEIESALWKDQYGQLAIAICYVAFRFADENGHKVIVDGEEGNIGLLWSAINPLFTTKKKQSFLHILVSEYKDMFTPIPVGGNTKVCAITGIESAACVHVDNKDTTSSYVLPCVKKQIKIGKNLQKEEGFKTFEEYAQKSYIGILRMDVDGLGARFIRGFENFGEYKDFSERLATFFDEEVRSIQQSKDFCNFLTLIYAGGDDLFAVGHWNKIIEFAAEVQKQFAAYIPEDEQLTISGGIAIVKPKFPIAKSALLSGEAEEQAKSYTSAAGVFKNAICFFDTCVSWQDEYDQVFTLKNELVTYISNKKISRGLLQQLMHYAEMASNNEMNYLWHATYYLTRMISDTPAKEARLFLKRLRDEHIPKDANHMRLLALAARWAEQETRIDNEENQKKNNKTIYNHGDN